MSAFLHRWWLDTPFPYLGLILVGTLFLAWWFDRHEASQVPLSKYKVAGKEYYTTKRTTYAMVGKLTVPQFHIDHHYRLLAWDGIAGVEVYVSHEVYYLVEEGEPYIGRWE